MGLVLLMLASSLTPAIAVQVNISVKVILKPDGTRPFGGMATTAGFGGEINHGNQVLMGRGYQLVVMEFLDIQPPVPNGEAADHWFSLPARGNRQTIENAALADPATWRWNSNAINFYVNDSGSGSCSFPGTGGSISLGKTIFSTGTVVHEIGHFFGLRHTHAGDSDCSAGLNSLADGDGLSETIPDDLCRDRDQLSQGYYSRNYDALTQAEQNFVNSSWLNVMSYHQEIQLLDAQMAIWTSHALGDRAGVCSARTWFVDRNGGGVFHDGSRECGLFSGSFSFVRDGVTSAQSGEIVIIRTGNYNELLPMTINKHVTLRASGGNVSIGIP